MVNINVSYDETTKQVRLTDGNPVKIHEISSEYMFTFNLMKASEYNDSTDVKDDHEKKKQNGLRQRWY